MLTNKLDSLWMMARKAVKKVSPLYREFDKRKEQILSQGGSVLRDRKLDEILHKIKPIEEELKIYHYFIETATTSAWIIYLTHTELLSLNDSSKPNELHFIPIQACQHEMEFPYQRKHLSNKIEMTVYDGYWYNESVFFA